MREVSPVHAWVDLRIVARRALGSVLVAVLVAACGKGDKPPPPTSGDPNATPESGPQMGGGRGGGPGGSGGVADEARQLFATVCATCHGPTGQGDGQAAASLNPKPRNYTD